MSDDRTPSDPHDATQDADRAWFRSHLDPIVGEPAPERWSDLDEQLAGSGAVPVPGPSGAGAGRTRTTFGIAAAILLLTAGAAVVVTRSGDGAGDPEVVAAAEPEPTGWYVPVGLPDGWTLEHVGATVGGPSCERHGVRWVDVEGRRSVRLGYDACDEAPDPADEMTIPPFGPDGPSATPESWPRVDEIDLGDGTVGGGLRIGDEPFFSIGWPDGGGAWHLTTIGLDAEEQVATARAFAADPSQADASTVAGLADAAALERLHQWSAPARQWTPSVDTYVTAPDGRAIGLHFQLPGSGMQDGGTSIAVAETIAGQPNEVWFYDDPSWAGRYGGAWPGADLTLFRWAEDPAGWIDDDQLRTFIASLRPATTAEWRAYLDTATGSVTEELRAVETLADLADLGYLIAPPEPPAEAAPEESTPAPDPGSEPDGDDGAAVSDLDSESRTSAPATLHPSSAPVLPSSDLTGLVVRLSMPAGTTVSLPGTKAVVLLENPTDRPISLDECSRGLMTWGLVPRGASGPLPPAPAPEDGSWTCAGSVVEVGPGDTVILDLERAGTDGFAPRRPAAITDRLGPHDAPYRGTVANGPYDAVVEIPTALGVLRASLPVQASASCPMSDELATRYRGVPIAVATDQAEEDGYLVVTGRSDGEQPLTTWDLDCDRLRAVTHEGLIVDYTFG